MTLLHIQTEFMRERKRMISSVFLWTLQVDFTFLLLDNTGKNKEQRKH